MANLANRINRQHVFARPRTANKGKAQKGKPSGFATRDQKRRDINRAFGYAAG